MKFILITKKQLGLIFCSAVAIIAAVAVSVSALTAADRKLPIYGVKTDKKQIAISFDAAWGADDTDTLIEILKKYNVKATFFVVGDWVDKYPEEVKKLSDNGHSIQNHSNTHPYMTKLSTEEMVAQLKNCNEKIAKLTGETPTLFRCPYGDYNNAVLNATESIDMKAIQWSVDSLDWKDTATADSIAKRVIEKTTNGSIILCHNDADHTPEALPTILETLQKNGYEFVLIKDLIYNDNYTIEHDGTQVKNSLQTAGNNSSAEKNS